MPRGLKLISYLIAMLFVWVCILSISIYRFSLKSDVSTADAAIVLGASVWGKKPSPVLQERVNHAITLYQQHKIQRIIFTGGVGAKNQWAESIVASQYALSNGVAVSDMYCETTSKITWENLQAAKQIVNQQQLNKVLIISDPLHLLRAVTMAHDLGLNAYPSPTPTTRYIGLQQKTIFLLREVYFYNLYLLQKQFMSLNLNHTMNIQYCSASLH